MADSEVIKILTEDIQSHRDYIHRLYKSAFTVGAVLVAIGVGLAYWILGKQLDAKVFEYRIVDSLRDRAVIIKEEIIRDSKEAAQSQVSTYIKEEIENKVNEILKPKIDKLSKENIDELVAKGIIPSGAVISFDRSSGCPAGWSDFAPAYGRFIRGIDKSGKSIDPEGLRSIGSLQEDQFGAHNHVVSEGRADTGVGGSKLPYLTGTGGRVYTSKEGGNETRPKNIALLYCKKN